MANFDKLVSQMDATLFNVFSEQVLINDSLYNAIYDAAFLNAFDSDVEQVTLVISQSDAVGIEPEMSVKARNGSFIISKLDQEEGSLVRLFLEKQ